MVDEWSTSSIVKNFKLKKKEFLAKPRGKFIEPFVPVWVTLQYLSLHCEVILKFLGLCILSLFSLRITEGQYLETFDDRDWMGLVICSVEFHRVLIIIQFIIDAPGTETNDGIPYLLISSLSPAKCTKHG